MIDLMQVTTKGYYVAGSYASLSIKKLLLPTMRASERLEYIYGQPTYSSSNFTDMRWWQKDSDGEQVRDPYSLLGTLKDEDPVAAVAQGGDAIIAYSALQRYDLDPLAPKSRLPFCDTVSSIRWQWS
jgi:hypothetical protein